MSVMSREALEGSSLSDLHAIAAELDIDGYRRMRKGELIAAILGEEYTGEEPAPPADDDDGDEEREERPRRSRSRSRRSREGSREGSRDSEPESSVEGTVEVLENGSGFVRLSPPDPSDGDVYISAAQIRRCELVSGDRVTGPVRAPRRSERYPSLVRVETINDRPADEVADGTPYEQLAAAFPAVAFDLGSDAVLAQVAQGAPIGRGSRVTVSGPFASGRTTLLRALAAALGAPEDVELTVVLAGSRPEERAEWEAAGVEVAAAAPLGASQESQSQVVDRAVEAARRAVSRGGHCAVVIDSLDGVSPAAARRALAAARNVPDGGSLTIVAAAREPLGGETTVIVLDPQEGAKAGHPVIDAGQSGTLRGAALGAS